MNPRETKLLLFFDLVKSVVNTYKYVNLTDSHFHILILPKMFDLMKCQHSQYLPSLQHPTPTHTIH